LSRESESLGGHFNGTEADRAEAIDMVEQQVQQILTKQEMIELLTKAEDYMEERPGVMVEAKRIYRDKHPKYFEGVEKRHNNIMKTVKNTYYAQKRSPVNGKVPGLWFGVNIGTTTGRPMSFSPFGSVRFSVPIADLLVGTNLYFSNFRCTHGSGGVHYVTLIVTIPDTEQDKICKTYLPKLDYDNNAFIQTVEDPDTGEERFYIRTGFNPWIHILYTENVDLNEWQGDDKVKFSKITSRRSNGNTNEKVINKVCKKCTVEKTRMAPEQ